MKRLSAAQAARWLTSLNDIITALRMSEDIGGITTAQWKQVWNAKADARTISHELLAMTAADIAVKTKETA
jgi:hypothetical protein